MADPMRIRAQIKDGVTDVRVLMAHIMENPAVWNQLFDLKHVSFGDLPNRALIDLRGFFEPETQRHLVTDYREQSKQVKKNTKRMTPSGLPETASD